MNSDRGREVDTNNSRIDMDVASAMDALSSFRTQENIINKSFLRRMFTMPDEIDAGSRLRVYNLLISKDTATASKMIDKILEKTDPADKLRQLNTLISIMHKQDAQVRGMPNQFQQETRAKGKNPDTCAAVIKHLQAKRAPLMGKTWKTNLAEKVESIKTRFNRR